ncbi:T9SS type A sorting domain-containing protein [Bacteroidota bacterium]
MAIYFTSKTTRVCLSLIVALFLLTLLPQESVSQITFERNYGGADDDIGKCVRQTSDEGYIICGYTKSFSANDYDAYIIRTDAFGDTLWTRILGGPGYDATYSLVITPDNGYVICGTYLDPGKATNDVWLIRMDDNGDTLWTKHDYSATSAEAHSITLNATNGYIITGVREDGGGTGHAFLMQTDTNGNENWSHDYPFWSTSGGNAVINTNDEGFLICGYIDTYNPSWNRNMGLIKTTNQGDTLWTRQVGGSAYEIGWSVCECPTGGYLASGYTTGYGALSGDGFIAKLTGLGSIEWQNHFGKSGLDVIYDISATSDLNYIGTGISGEQGSEFQEAWLIKIGESGDTLWSRSFGGYRKSYGYSVRQTDDEGYIFCGITNASGTNVYDIMLVKTTSDGVITTSLFQPEEETTYKVYPNPAHNRVIIEFPPGTKKMTITSPMGKLIREENLRNLQKLLLDLGGLPSGIYFLTFSDGESSIVKKLVIR